MRISDWSSDVCSSDLQHAQTGHPAYRANLSVQPCKGNRMASETSLNADIEDGVRRRDFINIAAVSFAGVGAATVVLPLVNQMNPSADRSEEHTSELKSLMRISYAVFCLKKKTNNIDNLTT